MFSYAVGLLLDGEGETARIYEMDKEVNELQIEIRKAVLKHLAINPEQDVTASLILTTVAVDFERIGDIAKNIAELPTMIAGELGESNYRNETENLRKALDRAIRDTKDTFVDANTEKARQLMDEFTWIAQKCDENVRIIVGDESLTVREAVVYTLLFRFLKRISAHARNFASSIVNPFHRVGFKPE
jgi:phosphate uptake regulator